MKTMGERPDGRPEINPNSVVKEYSVHLPKVIAENWFHFVVEEDGNLTIIWADPSDLIENSDLGEKGEE